MDFFSSQRDTEPVVTAARHLDLALQGVGRSREGLGIPENVLLAITPADLRVIRRTLALEGSDRIALGGAQVYRVADGQSKWAVAGPAVSAPITAAVLENLAATGVKRVVALGWCGSLQQDLVIGSLVVPTSAIREEGTSFHYLPLDAVAQADEQLVASLLRGCETAHVVATKGVVWTTDAMYREARAKVAAFSAQGVLGVEMEASAIFAVGACLGLQTAMLLVVSDELAGVEWRVGWQGEGFALAQEAACRIAIDVCRSL